MLNYNENDRCHFEEIINHQATFELRNNNRKIKIFKINREYDPLSPVFTFKGLINRNFKKRFINN